MVFEKSIESRFIGGAVLGISMVCIGWLVGYLLANRSLVADLWLQASEQKYLTMSGKIGPVTYLVTHNDYRVLEAYALKLDDVLGVEVYELPDKAAVAFSRADSESIQALMESAVVTNMRQQLIAMMCH